MLTLYKICCVITLALCVVVVVSQGYYREKWRREDKAAEKTRTAKDGA